MFAKIINQSKYFKITILVLNIALVLFVAIYVIFSIFGGHSKKVNTFDEVVASEYTSEFEENNQSDGMSGIYEMLITGSHADAGDNKVFNFGTNGIYSGFFDNQRTSVTNYQYNITESADGNTYVNIYTPEKTQYVSYKLGFDEESNLVLYNNNDFLVLVQ